MIRLFVVVGLDDDKEEEGKMLANLHWDCFLSQVLKLAE